jgi:hypothetical protein
MIEVVLPTLHPGQVNAYRKPGRFKAIRCGRRWGKTDYAKTIACDGAAKGENIGWFAPDYKIQSEAFNEVADILAPIKKASSRIDGVFRTTTGGRIDFWTLENERAGRSRKYHKVIIDEAAFTKPNMLSVWEKAIRPTLVDYRGSATVLSNTNGIDEENFFYVICTDPKYGFVQYHAPTHENPYLPQEELDGLIADNHPLVYRQEYLAEFVDWSGVRFFDQEDLLVDGKPIAYPHICDGVFATIDSATKTGKENDGTGVVYWAIAKHAYGQNVYPLTILDYDLTQIEGSLLEAWLPSVFHRLEELARQCRARVGSLGVYIEDKASGMILIQQAQRRGWSAQAIDSKLTSVGKSERAFNVSSYVHRKMVKFTEAAYNKTVVYKGTVSQKETSRNHLLSQVLGFRIGVKDQVDDDLLDCFTYGIEIGLGSGAWK